MLRTNEYSGWESCSNLNSLILSIATIDLWTGALSWTNQSFFLARSPKNFFTSFNVRLQICNWNGFPAQLLAERKQTQHPSSIEFLDAKILHAHSIVSVILLTSNQQSFVTSRRWTWYVIRARAAFFNWEVRCLSNQASQYHFIIRPETFQPRIPVIQVLHTIYSICKSN